VGARHRLWKRSEVGAKRRVEDESGWKQLFVRLVVAEEGQECIDSVVARHAASMVAI